MSVCKLCKKIFLPSYKRKMYCSLNCQHEALRKHEKRICQYCGKEFELRRSNVEKKFCSKDCLRKFKINISLENKKIRDKRYCVVCGKEYQKNGTKTCSAECWKINKTNKASEHSKQICQKKFKNYKNINCEYCGKNFIPRNKTSKFCSYKCKVKSKNVRRNIDKILINNGDYDCSINLIKLFQRDKGKCALCGDYVNMELSSIDNYYGSIDHIIPRSRGGKHIWDNVQLAHRICNSKKRDKIDSLAFMKILSI